MLLSTVVRLPSSECPAGRQSPLSPHSRSSHKWCDAAPVEEFAVSVDLCVNHWLPDEAQRAVADIHRISQRPGVTPGTPLSNHTAVLLQRLFDDKLRAVDFPRERLCHRVRVVVPPAEDAVVRARRSRGHLRAVPGRNVVEHVLLAAAPAAERRRRPAAQVPTGEHRCS